ncbi:threonine-phosphate decarboxylase CobD [Paraglaciecola sp. L3A3]|uniref:threonine-phosphate decarboxylase CobD n=1 Tax=Paraglaciecola sp. L3A3 TaxID=2686358 RepID=UPI00131D393A|nr:threonine-phosphate decarboxylase CobD [Paraglaciecola sp. L3A3]
MTKPLIHGGQLILIAQQYALPVEDWLDLSTGIAPYSYPVKEVPEHIWRRLPEENSALVHAAQQYYQCPHILPISGSQAVIQLLPQLFSQQQNKGQNSPRVFIPQIGYQEHNKAWQNSQFELIKYTDSQAITSLTSGDVVVLINPNNPSGRLYTLAEVAELFSRVKQAKAYLIIDEAFMDCSPEHSFIKHSSDPQLLVLRSVGKFYALAGLRLGFVAAAPIWLQKIAALLGPWSVNGPAQYIGQQALSDSIWQEKQRARLHKLSLNLKTVLQQHFKSTPQGTALFQTIHHKQAPQIFHQLCQQGIYVRLCDEQNALRFGTPTPPQLERLEKALSRMVQTKQSGAGKDDSKS